MSNPYQPTVWETLMENKKVFYSVLIVIALIFGSVIGLAWRNSWGLFGDTQVSDTVIREYNYREGNLESDVSLVYFLDYECVACQRFEPTLNQFVLEYDDRINVVYKHLPIVGIYSTEISRAAQAAGRQGKFFEYKDEAFARTTAGENLTSNSLEEIATNLNLNVETWNADRNSLEVRDQVDQDEKDWRTVPVPESSRDDSARPTGTPTLMIVKDGEIQDWWVGGLGAEEMGALVDQYLES